MFTDRLFREYCLQIREIEEKMEKEYRDIVAGLTHPEYRRFFSRLLADEREHQTRIDAVINLFKRG